MICQVVRFFPFQNMPNVESNRESSSRHQTSSVGVSWFSDQCCRGAKCTTRCKEPNVCEAQNASDVQHLTLFFINLKDYEFKDKTQHAQQITS